MKKSSITLLLSFLSVISFAQVVKIADRVYDIDSLKKKASFFWVDDKLELKSDLTLPAEIFDIRVKTLNDIYPALNGQFRDPYEVDIVTRQGAIKAYQRKFSRLSDNYKNYIVGHGDYGVLYLLINTKGELDTLEKEKDDLIKKLFEIPDDKIADVNFSIMDTCCGTNRTCIISLKEQ